MKFSKLLTFIKIYFSKVVDFFLSFYVFWELTNPVLLNLGSLLHLSITCDFFRLEVSQSCSLQRKSSPKRKMETSISKGISATGLPLGWGSRDTV
jgi:hypothetical protein